MKATEKYFLVVLFVVMYKVVAMSESVDEVLKCDPSNKAIEMKAVLSCGTVFMLFFFYNVVLVFASVDEILK